MQLTSSSLPLPPLTLGHEGADDGDGDEEGRGPRADSRGQAPLVTLDFGAIGGLIRSYGCLAGAAWTREKVGGA